MSPVPLVVRWARLPAARRRLLVEAVAELLVARIQLLPIPGADWQRALGTRGDATAPPPVLSSATDPVHDQAHDVGVAVRAAAARVPWRSVCLPQAIAAHRMLRRRGIAARAVVGARRSVSERSIDLHVWVVVGGRVVVGGGGHDSFTAVVAYDA